MLLDQFVLKFLNRLGETLEFLIHFLFQTVDFGMQGFIHRLHISF